MSNQNQNILIVQNLYAAFAKRELNVILNMLSPEVVGALNFTPSPSKHGACQKIGVQDSDLLTEEN